jgi:hypothetical protein
MFLLFRDACSAALVSDDPVGCAVWSIVTVSCDSEKLETAAAFGAILKSNRR